MKVYIDGMFYRCSGVGRIFENLLSTLPDREGFDVIHTVLPSSLRAKFQEQFPSPMIRPVFVPYGPMGYGDLVRKGRILRSLAGRVDLFFFPGHNVPLSPPGRYIVSVNDVTVFSSRFEAPWYRKVGFRWLLSRAVHGSEKVVTISQAVKLDLVREFSLSPEKVIVIYPWVKDLFFRVPAEGDEPTDYPVDGEYILYVGLRIAHKNLDGLIRAFLLVAEEFPGLRLVIAGSRYRERDVVDRWKPDSRLSGRLLEILDPPDETLVRLYSGAKAFVFPSFAEGFGLPPLEAMACGAPVVCSDIPVFREVYGEGVRYVDPGSPESIASGIRSVLSDRSESDRLTALGKRQSERYTQERGISLYLEVLLPGPGPCGPAVRSG